DVRLGALLRQWVSDRRPRNHTAPVLARLPGLRRSRRYRAGAGLYFACLDAPQMVPRPTGYGDRHGDHGVRRRCDDRVAAGGQPDEAFRYFDFDRGGSDLRDDGSALPDFYDVRRLHGAPAARGLETGGLSPARSA